MKRPPLLSPDNRFSTQLATAMHIRPALAQDLEDVIALRLAMFAETDELQPAYSRDEIAQATRAFFSDHLDSALSRSWVALLEQRIVAVGTLAFFMRPPYPGNASGKEAYLLNMFTLPAYRRRGCSKAILEQALAHARDSGCGKVWLHAFPDGLALYRAAGFRQDESYMEWLPA